MIPLLETQDLIPPTPPPRRKIPSEDLQANITIRQDILEQSPQVRLPGVDVRNGQYHL